MTARPVPAAAPIRTDLAFHGRPEGVADAARAAEERGIDGLLVAEIRHDPFPMLALAAAATRRIGLGTGVAIAFARTPMALAHSAWDLQRLAGGRAVIGLGSQVAPHVTRRYGMPWSRPAARMREFAAATRAIWHSWQTGDRLDFRGDFYSHTLMTPMFDPGPLPEGAPAIRIAAVGPLMTAVAGEVGDGLVCHPFTTPGYLRETTLPAVRAARAGAEAARKPWTVRPFEVAGTAMVVTGRTAEQLAANTTAVRERIAFYGSTPAYRPVLEQHGWGALHEALHTLSMEGRWQEMGRLVDDEVLHAFAVVGEPEAAGRAVRERFAGLLDRVTVSLPYACDDGLALDVLGA
jgi:probable F420-dependent oxidoreductase